MTRLTIELPDDVAAAFAERATAVGHAGAEAYLRAFAQAKLARAAEPARREELPAYVPHTWAQIEAKVLEALNDPSPPIPVTPEWWETLWREGRERRAAHP